MTPEQPVAVEIAKMLVLSTSHLREKTCNDWLLNDCPWTCAEKGDVGYFMYATDEYFTDVETKEVTSTDGTPIPNEIILICQFARAHGCDWVMFDCDGPIQDGLVVYEW